MKNRVVLLVVIFLFVLGFFGCDNGGSSSTPVNNKPIVCFGDSLTEGYGASASFEIDKSKSYPAFLQNKVPVNVINAGITGDTSADGLARMDRDVLSKDPQMVIILLGGNDFLQRRSANDAKNDLQTIINKAKAAKLKIYLASFMGDAFWETLYLTMFPGALSDASALLGEYKRIYTELRTENQDIGHILTVWSGIGITDMSDPIHPNAGGYSKMADNIFSVIKSHFE